MRRPRSCAGALSGASTAVAWRVGSDPGRWVVSTADALGAELGEAWGRHLGRVEACREVCERAAGLARTVGADLAGLPVMVDA